MLLFLSITLLAHCYHDSHLELRLHSRDEDMAQCSSALGSILYNGTKQNKNKANIRKNERKDYTVDLSHTRIYSFLGS